MPRWTPETRQRHADAIHAWKPWENSTGPRTGSGKTRTRANAMKHGLRSQVLREIRRLLREHGAFVKTVMKTAQEKKKDG